MLDTRLSPRLLFLIILSLVALLFIISKVKNLQERPIITNLIKSSNKKSEVFTCNGCNSGQLKPAMNDDGQWKGYFIPLP